MRNFANLRRGLEECHRVLRPGGRFLCLEFSRLQWGAVAAAAYDVYSFALLPVLGAVVAGNRDAYQYLVESIRRFPDQEAFAAMLSAAGFLHVSYSNILGGVVAVHSGFK
ncbi:UNVERIFIED_CONTAM: hypothetical protein H355_012823 [Colinus virginianus]|nr:hypothetical protein H355_012823 [Colinus virginianus]